MPGRRRCPPVTGSSARRRLRGNTGAPEPVGGRDRPPGICVGALPCPALCWADRAHSFCEETLIKRLSPQPAPHLVTGCSFALVGQRPRRSPRIPRASVPSSFSVLSRVIWKSLAGRSTGSAGSSQGVGRKGSPLLPLSRKTLLVAQPPSRRPPLQTGPPACACLSRSSKNLSWAPTKLQGGALCPGCQNSRQVASHLVPGHLSILTFFSLPGDKYSQSWKDLEGG